MASPELADLPPERRVEAYEKASRRAMRRPAFLLVILFGSACVLGSIVLGQWFFGSGYNPGLPQVVVMLAAAALGGGLAVTGGYVFRRHYLPPQLWKVMLHTCGGCGYDLTANASGVCPECGRAVARPEGETVE